MTPLRFRGLFVTACLFVTPPGSHARPVFHEGLAEQIARLDARLSIDGRSVRLLLERAELHRLHGDSSAALLDLDRVVRLDPGLAQVDLLRARALFDAREHEQARQAVDRFLNRPAGDRSADGKGSSGAHLLRARILVVLGEPEAALTDLEQALDQAPIPSPDLYVERSRLLASLGEIDRALAGLDQGIRRLGPVVSLELPAIDLEMARGQPDAALARLDLLAARSARKESWLSRRGDLLLQAGRRAQAREAFLAAGEALARLRPKQRTSGASLRLAQHVQDSLNQIDRSGSDHDAVPDALPRGNQEQEEDLR